MPRPLLPLLDPAPLRRARDLQGRTNNEWAEKAGCSFSELQQRIYEPMSWAAADRFATALGLHPAEVWGDDWWSVAKAYDALYTDEKQEELMREQFRYREGKAARLGLEYVLRRIHESWWEADARRVLDLEWTA